MCETLRHARYQRQNRRGVVHGPQSGFSRSVHSTTAASGGFRYSPVISWTSSTKLGSGDTLNSSTRRGFKPNACQIRRIADGDIPTAAAMERLDRCVAFAGVSSRSFHYDSVHRLIGDTTRSTRTRSVVKPEHTLLAETLTLFADRSRITTQHASYINIRLAISRG